jgi:ketosteroid isomerase-like protein
MSEENVDQARRGYDALNRRDLDAFLALMDPEVEFTTRFAQMGAPVPRLRRCSRMVGRPARHFPRLQR